MKETTLLQQIVSLTEAAYRRGFQQGIVSGATNEQAAAFRFRQLTRRERRLRIYEQSPIPPNMRGSPTTALARLLVETHGADDRVSQLIRSLDTGETHLSVTTEFLRK